MGCGISTPENVAELSREDKANWLSLITFSWLNPLLSLGSRMPLESQHCPRITDNEKSFSNFKVFEKYFDSREGNLGWALFHSFGLRFMLGGLLKLVHDSCQLLKPVLLNLLIQFIQNSDGTDLTFGVYLSLAIFGVTVVQSFMLRNYFFINYRTGMLLKSATTASLFRKQLRLSQSARGQYSTGGIINLMSVDTTRLQDLTTYLHTVWSGILTIVVGCYLLYLQVSYAAFGGIAVMILMIPLAKCISSLIQRVQERIMTIRDERIKWTQECINGMKVIKLQGWEESILAKIQDLRKSEISRLNFYYKIETLSSTLWGTTTVFVAVATFGLYTYLGNTLKVETIFTSLALFDILRFPLNVFPSVINDIVNARVTSRRIADFLCSEEMVEVTEGSLQSPGVEIKDGYFSWDAKQEAPDGSGSSASQVDDSKSSLTTSLLSSVVLPGGLDEKKSFSLRAINLTISNGAFISIIGQVGSGKSALLSSFLSNITRQRGSIHVKGTIAYVPQQPWIMNCTLRDNILFGLPYEEEKYFRTLRACSLLPDMLHLPDYDLTEIGEKGINLSGGQKSRIAIARAVYSDAELFLFDDVLSAVDKHVARHIFEHAMCGILRGKIRVFVTNALEFLPSTDRVVVLEDGRIVEDAPYGSLSSFAFKSLSDAYKNNQLKETEHSTGGDVSPASHTTPTVRVNSKSVDKEKGESSATSEALSSEREREIVEKIKANASATDVKRRAEELRLLSEERVVGKVEWAVYKQYFSHAGGVVIIPSVVIFLFFANQGLQVFSEFWLSLLTTTSGAADIVWYYIDVYIIINAVVVVVYFIMTWTVFKVGLVASQKLHNSLVARLIRAPMSFFDITPSGRLLNRVSKDVSVVDDSLPNTMMSYLSCLTSVTVVVGTVIYVTPMFVIALVPILAIYNYSQNYFVKSLRELKRLESISRSPIFSLFAESIDGSSTIRAFDSCDRFIKESDFRVDENASFWFLLQGANCWLGERLEFVGALLSFGSALFSVLQLPSHHDDPLFTALAGLSISSALSVTQSLNWFVRMAAQQETEIISVERILQYSNIDVEKPAVIEDNRPPSAWPQCGRIEIRDLTLRYRPSLPVVLDSLSLVIEGGLKVGVVGRTGAGKSSLILALLRIVEPESGCVVIDGVDTSKIGLDDLRSKISVISQDPVMFSGTVRFNLDPFNEFSDDDIWNCLEQVKLKDFVTNLEGGKAIYSIIQERGSNLSVGQRQLLCIARSLLKRSRIVLLDEATSSCDSVSDTIVQTTLRTAFKDATVITIAHRIHTILDSDMILCLSNGKVCEYDTPRALLKNTSGVFYSLVQNSSNE